MCFGRSYSVASTTFGLYEDDGISLRYRDGDCADVVFDLQTAATEIALSARVSGSYALPYQQITVELPPGENRRVFLDGAGVALTFAP